MSASSTQGKVGFPHSVDLYPTSKCNLRCTFCWGPDHLTPDRLSTEDWKHILDFFAENGTRAVVFSGGEPLLRKDLSALLSHAKTLGMSVTLSTNAILLPKVADKILPFVDEVGIPLDGSTQERNSRMRIGNPKSFHAALFAVQYVWENYPHIEITIRTVVSRVNKDDIHAVGGLLSELREGFHRWKLYQFTPASIGALNKEEHQISDEDFNLLAAEVCNFFSELHVAIYPSSKRVGRYIFVGSKGEILSTNSAQDYNSLGNFFDFTNSQLVKIISAAIDTTTNQEHGSKWPK